MKKWGKRVNTGRNIGYKYFIKGKEYLGIQAAADANNVQKSCISKWIKNSKKPDCYKEKLPPEFKLDKNDIEGQAKKAGMTPLEFLESVINDADIDVKVRITAANYAAPYVHKKADNKKSKGEIKEERAKEAGQGKFSAGRAPLKVVK